MALVLLTVSIAASIPNANANQNSRSFLQFNETTTTTPAPTLYGGDLSSCDDTVTISLDANETEFYISINSVPEQGIVGIDACDYNAGNNDFDFYLQLEDFAGSYVSGASYSDNPGRCSLTGYGAYLEWTRQSYYNDTDYWLHVYIYYGSADRTLQLTRRCDILATTWLPTMSPTTPAPITPAGEIYCNDRVENTLDYGPHFYEFYLSTAARVHFQDCETEFDPNLYVYDMNTMEEVQDSVCDGDDCGNCASGVREEYTLTLEPGSYYVMIRECCSNNENTGGLTYVIETSCTDPNSTRNPVTERPTMSPTTPVPITPVGEIYCNDRVENNLDYDRHFYEFYLSTASRVHFQDCETDFDSNLFVYDMNTMEVQNTFCYDDCGNCTNGLREEYTLTLEPGSYYVMIRECCGNYQDTGGSTYVIEISCTDFEIPTTANPTRNPVTDSPTTYEPSRSPLFWNETHPPTTTNPTRNPVTKRPTRSPVTAAPTAAPVTTTDDVVGGSGAEWYSVRFSVVIMLIGTLFV